MSASRTLLRKLKYVPAGTTKPGGRRLKRGTPDRRIVLTEDVGPYEHTLHATKGHRWVRRPS